MIVVQDLMAFLWIFREYRKVFMKRSTLRHGMTNRNYIKPYVEAVILAKQCAPHFGGADRSHRKRSVAKTDRNAADAMRRYEVVNYDPRASGQHFAPNGATIGNLPIY